jgi:two-component system OmpR family sensor kinase
MGLIGVGEWFYYKLAKEQIIEREKAVLNTKLRQFLQQNPFLMRAIRFRNFTLPPNIKIAITFNGEQIYSNSPPLPIKVEHIEVKRWGELKIEVMAPFPKEKLAPIKRQLLFFTLFVLLFLTGIAYLLGKLFLSPMKEVIQNLERFIRDATHEMNTPISTILTNIELLEGESKPIQRIKRGAMRLNKIFDDLKFIRLHHHRPRQIEKISLPDFIRERLLLFEGTIHQKNLTLSVELNNKEIEIDREDLTRLVDNLISNSIKYAPSGSKVEIGVNGEKFWVINRGKIENPTQVIRKFYRENRSEGGFGLGLYIVKEICTRYQFKFKIFNRKGRVVAEVEFEKG